MTNLPLLTAKDIHKRFPGVHALRGVSCELHQGEVLALLGENGAGKSTLMKILAGIQPPDQGQILLHQKPIHLPDAQAAMRHGISLIHQELNLAENLNAAANVFLGREPRSFGLIRNSEMLQRANEILTRVGFGLPPDTPVANLSPGKRQLIEIAKSLSTNARIIIMDEPTASLSAAETEKLFQVIRSLKNDGVSIIYISHRLNEIREIADRVTVLRDGANAGDLTKDQITHQNMIRLMVGRDSNEFFQHTPATIGAQTLQIQNLRTTTHPTHPIHLQLHKGEIVALAGLVGAGRTELLRAIAAIDQPLDGKITAHGKNYAPRTPTQAIKHGVALIPEDRKAHGLTIDFTVGDNITLPSLKGLLRSTTKEHHIYTTQAAALNIKCSGPDQKAKLLSGGNQQKIVIGKWLAMNPSILLLDEPTRGIDVGAKKEIYQIIEQLAAQGTSILFASSDLEEIIGLADRCIVMHEGKITGELPRHQLTEQNIMRLATNTAAA